MATDAEVAHTVAMRRLLPLVALLLALTPRPARACSCGMSGPRVIAPADGATDVPQDALLWIGEGGYRGEASSEWWQIVDAGSSAPRGGTWRTISDEHVQSLAFAFDPALVEGERVQLRRADGTIVSTFTVGARATSPAPGTPFVGAAAYAAVWSEGSSCDPVTRTVRFAVGPEGVLAVVDTSGLATAGDGPVAEGVAKLGTPQDASLGMGDCYYGWSEAAPGAELAVRAGLFALNGRFSGWSEPVTLRFPLDPPIGAEREPGVNGGEGGEGGDSDEGCATAPGHPTPALLPLLATVLLFLRRRR